MKSPSSISTDVFYKYRTLSVEHLEDLQADIDTLKFGGRLSNHEIFRGYLSDMKFEIPESLPNAASLIVIAVPAKLMIAGFHLHGERHEAMLPPGYYATRLTQEILQSTVRKEILKDAKCRLERATKIHLKLLAVRSGLGRYGRNNLCHVDGMGSLLRLFAYFTDHRCSDDWTEMKMMDNCKDCRICMNHCPNNCIVEEKSVIDAGRCLSLYNEVAGEFPDWISPHAHNALIGCMKCQMHCPANREALKLVEKLEDVTEEETQRILNGTPDEKLLASLSKKLRGFVPAGSNEMFPIFTRNLRALLNSQTDLRI